MSRLGCIWLANVPTDMLTSSSDHCGNRRNGEGKTALHLVSSQRFVQGISLLLVSGADANAVDRHGKTPLHEACADSAVLSENEHRDDTTRNCVKILVEAGSEVNARDSMGQTPLHIAAQSGCCAAVEALLLRGAFEVGDNMGNRPTHLAAAAGHVDTLEVLTVGPRERAHFTSGGHNTLCTMCTQGDGSDVGTPSYLRHGPHFTECTSAEGYRYYVDNATGLSTWEKPDSGAPSCESESRWSWRSDRIQPTTRSDCSQVRRLQVRTARF